MDNTYLDEEETCMNEQIKCNETIHIFSPLHRKTSQQGFCQEEGLSTLEELTEKKTEIDFSVENRRVEYL